MTSAKDNTPDHDELITERFGPLPVRDPGTVGRRLQAIATLHALADWFAAHTDVPVPVHMTVTCYTADASALEELAAAMGQEIFGDRPMFSIDDPVHPWVRGGLNQSIYVTVQAPRDERPL